MRPILFFLTLGLAVAACQSNTYRDFSESNQRRAGDTDQDVASRHERAGGDPRTAAGKPISPEEKAMNSSSRPDSPSSDEESGDDSNQNQKVRIIQDASETEKNKSTTERVEVRHSRATPTPTPTDPMNKPLDPIGRPLTPNPDG